MTVQPVTEYITVAFENDIHGGMAVIRIIPYSMSEEDWYNVRNLMNIYAWTETLYSLMLRVRNFIGNKALVIADENVLHYGYEESNEMYMDYRDNAEITFHRTYMEEVA